MNTENAVYIVGDYEDGSTFQVGAEQAKELANPGDYEMLDVVRVSVSVIDGKVVAEKMNTHFIDGELRTTFSELETRGRDYYANFGDASAEESING